jgi:hypothetical protein
VGGEAMTERWLPVVGFEGFYEVSDLGRVRGVDRIVKAKLGSQRRQRGIILRPGLSGTGYWMVRLTKDAIGRSYAVHRLVLEAFAGPCPDDMEGCHNNGDRLDNRLVNLRWDTDRANNIDTVMHGAHRNASKTHCKHGHAFTPDNTYYYGAAVNGQKRHCKTCIYNRAAQYRAQRKEHTNA